MLLDVKKVATIYKTFKFLSKTAPILECIHQNPGISTLDLCLKLRLHQSDFFRQIGIMSNMDLVTHKKDGRRKKYFINQPIIDKWRTFMEELNEHTFVQE